MTARKLPRSGLVQPLIHMPFCPDDMLLVGFSGSFATCPCSAIPIKDTPASIAENAHAFRSKVAACAILAEQSDFGDVSQVLMCYSPRVSLQPTTLNMIE